MILTLAIKNFKKYRNINLIPVSYGYKFSSYLGPNGIGKTTIFEALNSFLNNTEWIPNNSLSSSEEKGAGVCALFLLPKKFSKLTDSEKNAIEIISNFFWKTPTLAHNDFTSAIQSYPEKLKIFGYNKDNSYLVFLGQNSTSEEIFIPQYQNQIIDLLQEENIENELILSLIKKIKGYYRFIYLPSEADSSSFSKIESTFVQKLIDEDIRNKIKSIIPKPSITKINEDLSSYLNEINSLLIEYEYKGKSKNKITENDLVDKIFSAYFATKILNKVLNRKLVPIHHLSSGEKKKALIDLASALIERSSDRDYQIIFAIDEPDASIHITACFDLFEKISNITSLCKPNPQVLINTHWYGFIPIMRFGYAHSLSVSSDLISFTSLERVMNFSGARASCG